MSKEKLNFKIELSGTYHDKLPKYSILLNGNVMASGEVGDKHAVEFVAELEEEKEHVLSIRLENKTHFDTVQNEDKTEILKDMLLNIESISVDEIELGDLKWNISEFIGDDANRPVLKRCVNLGWNGSYNIKFTCPFYVWLLENC